MTCRDLTVLTVGVVLAANGIGGAEQKDEKRSPRSVALERHAPRTAPEANDVDRRTIHSDWDVDALKHNAE